MTDDERQKQKILKGKLLFIGLAVILPYVFYELFRGTL